MLLAATRAAIAATVFLAAGMSAPNSLFDEPATAAVTARARALFIWLW